MTAAVLDRPTLRTGDPGIGDGVTLEQLLTSAHEEARANGSTECPVCHARMTVCHARTSSTRAREAGGLLAAECGGCGSRLS